MRSPLFGLCLCLLATAAATADEKKPVEEFKICGCKIGMTFQDFDKMHPKAAPWSGDPQRQLGSKSYVVVSDDGSVAIFKFLKSKLIYMTIGWDHDSLLKIGGPDTITKKMTDKYGTADAASQGITSRNPFRANYFWLGDKNMIIIKYDEKGIDLYACEVAALQELNKLIDKDKKTPID